MYICLTPKRSGTCQELFNQNWGKHFHDKDFLGWVASFEEQFWGDIVYLNIVKTLVRYRKIDEDILVTFTPFEEHFFRRYFDITWILRNCVDVEEILMKILWWLFEEILWHCVDIMKLWENIEEILMMILWWQSPPSRRIFWGDIVILHGYWEIVWILWYCDIEKYFVVTVTSF